MVTDPLVGPRHCLAPPIGVRVKDAKVDVWEGEFVIKISAVCAVVGPVGGFDVEPALAAPGHEVVGVDGLDEGAHFVDPGGEDCGGAAGWASGEVSYAVGAAAGFVCEFPGHDCWGVFVAGYHLFDVGFEDSLDLGEAVELLGGRVSLDVDLELMGINCNVHRRDIGRRG